MSYTPSSPSPTKTPTKSSKEMMEEFTTTVASKSLADLLQWSKVPRAKKVTKGDDDIKVKKVLERLEKIDKAEFSKEGETGFPLFVALKNHCHLDIIFKVLERSDGKGVNEEGELDVGMEDSESIRCLPLHLALSRIATDTKGNRLIKSWLEPKQRGIELVKSLLERHKEAAQKEIPSAPAVFGFTEPLLPLHYVLLDAQNECQFTELFQVLLKAYPKAAEQPMPSIEQHEGKLPIHLALTMSSSVATVEVENICNELLDISATGGAWPKADPAVMLDRVADGDSVDADRRAVAVDLPLHTALEKRRSKELVERIVNADVTALEAPNRNGKLPLEMVLHNHFDPDILKLLLRRNPKAAGRCVDALKKYLRGTSTKVPNETKHAKEKRIADEREHGFIFTKLLCVSEEASPEAAASIQAHAEEALTVFWESVTRSVATETTAHLALDPNWLRDVLQSPLVKELKTQKPDVVQKSEELLEDVKAMTEEAANGTKCKFWMLKARRLREAGHELNEMPKFQDLLQDRKRADWLELVEVSLRDACERKQRKEHLAVSHCWETPEHPDMNKKLSHKNGVQWKELLKYLKEKEEIEHVFVDYCCMPQGEKNRLEVQEFSMMLANINLLYLGSTVLILLDQSYMSRFWTQFEAWLAMQIASEEGLQSAAEQMRRCDIVTIHNANEFTTKSLIDTWAYVTSTKAHEILESSDVKVTNQSDKDVQLPKIKKFDGVVKGLGLRKLRPEEQMTEEEKAEFEARQKDNDGGKAATTRGKQRQDQQSEEMRSYLLQSRAHLLKLTESDPSPRTLNEAHTFATNEYMQRMYVTAGPKEAQAAPTAFSEVKQNLKSAPKAGDRNGGGALPDASTSTSRVSMRVRAANSASSRLAGGDMDNEETAALDPKQNKFSLQELRGLHGDLPAGVNLFIKEHYLDPTEFKQVFGMSAEEFAQLKPWKQRQLKQEVGLF